MRATVLIVDDHDDFRDAARNMLEAAGFDVVGGAANAADAIAEEARLKPAIVLLDIQLPDRDGFDVAERMARSPDPPKVILISSREASAFGDRISSSAALGFIAKLSLSGQTINELIG